MTDLLTSNVPLGASAKTTETVLPDWYTSYAQQLLANQQAVSNTPYTTYQGPRVAGFTPEQQQAFTQTAQAAQAYQPGLQQATQVAQQAATMSPLTVAQPYLTQAAAPATANVAQYMNPYMDQVVNRVGELGARTLREQLLPQIGEQFIKAGGYGGSRQAEAIGRSLRDVAESTQAKQAELLASGYGGALSASQADLARAGQLAATAGQIGATNVSAQQTSAEQLAKLAAAQQSLGLTGAGALQNVGTAQQALNQQNLDVGYQDFLRQQGYDQTQINAMLNTLGGVATAVPKATMETGYAPVSSSDLTKTTNSAQDLANLLATLKPFFTNP
jgi:hypothetical protein